MKMENQNTLFCCCIVICLSINVGMTMGKKCEDGFITRTRWRRSELELFCCKKVTENCTQGYYVKKCLKDLKDDMCAQCPNSTWLADETNSDNVHPCVEYICPSEAVRVNFLPTTGCHKPCICNTKKDWYGYDSCNCIPFTATCPNGTELSLNGKCLTNRMVADELNELRPKNGVQIGRNELVNCTRNVTTGNNLTVETTGMFRLITTLISVTVIFFLMVIAVYMIYIKCFKENNLVGNPEPIIPLNLKKNSSDPLTDSRISLETSSSISQTFCKTEIYDQNDPEQALMKPGKLIAKVLPSKQASGTENISSQDQSGIPLIIQERPQDYLAVELGSAEQLSPF